MSFKMRCISNTICEKKVYVCTCLCWNMHEKRSRIHQKKWLKVVALGKGTNGWRQEWKADFLL